MRPQQQHSRRHGPPRPELLPQTRQHGGPGQPPGPAQQQPRRNLPQWHRQQQVLPVQPPPAQQRPAQGGPPQQQHLRDKRRYSQISSPAQRQASEQKRMAILQHRIKAMAAASAPSDGDDGSGSPDSSSSSTSSGGGSSGSGTSSGRGLSNDDGGGSGAGGDYYAALVAGCGQRCRGEIRSWSDDDD